VEENQMKKAKPYDSAEFLNSPKAIKYYLEEAMESGDPQLMSHAVGVVARAKSMSKIARESGVTRYRSLSRKGKPEFSTIVSVLRSLGLGLSVRVVASNKVSKLGEKPNKKTRIAV
jgi:probable addiction module antidote protein